MHFDCSQIAKHKYRPSSSCRACSALLQELHNWCGNHPLSEETRGSLFYYLSDKVPYHVLVGDISMFDDWLRQNELLVRSIIKVIYESLE